MASKRKPKVVRRILRRVDLPVEVVVTAVDVKREPEDVEEAMSPDSNHNLQCQGGALPEVEITMKLVKSEPELETSEDESSQEHDPHIREYLGRTDTAVVFPEDPAGLNNTGAVSISKFIAKNGFDEQHKVPLPGAGGVPQDPRSASPEEDCFIKCSFCGKGQPSFQALKEHVDLLHPGGAFPCVHCAATFPSREHLDKHEQLHSATQQVSCKVCNKTFANVYRLQRHMISHDESAVLRKFKCPECEKAFKFKHHLKEHIRIHSGEKPFKCSNCSKRFSHSGSYSSHMTSKKCLVMNLKVNQRNMNRALDLKHPSQGQLSAFRQQQVLKQSPTHNNNNFPPHLQPKYQEAAAAILSNLQPQNLNNPFQAMYFPPFNAQNTLYSSPYTHQSLLKCKLELNKTSLTNHDEVKIKEVRDNETPEREENEVVIKEEVKEDPKEEEEHKPFAFSDRHPPGIANGGDLEEVKRILETVNARVTTHLLSENMQKLSPTSYSSGCPSVASGATTPPAEERTEIFYCRYCRKVFTSAIEQHQHERYLCNEEDEKSEGLMAKLEEVATKTDVNGVSCSGSEDETRGSREIMTEDEDGDTVDQDGRKVRVRSQISEDQLIILKQNYTHNPRPKREELSKIAERVGLAVRVVQVWFQNNRARDRREGRLVHVPYLPQSTSWFSSADSPLLAVEASEQPLDLSTKKSQGSSPAESPRSESEEAVNLTQKPQVFVRPLFQQRSPSPLDSSRLARMLTQYVRFPTANGTPLPSPLYYASPEQSASRSPVHAVALCNGSSSPNFGADIWWKRNLTLETAEAEEFVCEEPAKRAKMAAESADSDGQLFSCDQCEKAFSKQSSLARHRYEHSGQRPHKCDICLKAFKHKHHLTEHKRLHSGEKPFQCGKCFKRFSHSGSYSQHMNHRYSYCKPYRE